MYDFQKNSKLLKFEKNELTFSEPKIDGISATLIYEKGILTKGLSRKRADWRRYFRKSKNYRDCQKNIVNEVPDLLEIRCEVFISKRFCWNKR